MAPGLVDTTELPSHPAPKGAAPHIFAPLSADEIKFAGNLLKSTWPESTQLYFRTITLEEPPKAEAIKHLAAQRRGEAAPAVDRKAFINYNITNTVCHIHGTLLRTYNY